MRRKINAVLLTVISVCCIVFCSTQTSTAESEDYSYETFYMIMEEYGLKTAKSLSGYSDIKVKEIIPVISFDAIQSGFMFSFTKDSKPYGCKFFI